MTAVANSFNTNTGLQQTVTASGLAARVSSLPAIASPAFKVPRTLADNYAVNTSAAATTNDFFTAPDEAFEPALAAAQAGGSFNITQAVLPGGGGTPIVLTGKRI